MRYLWEGTPKVGETLVFTQVYYPHAPYRSLPTSNNPNPDARNSKAAYANNLQATAHASGIQVVQDNAEATVLRLELESDKVEWAAFNPQGKELQLGETATTSRLAYRNE